MLSIGLAVAGVIALLILIGQCSAAPKDTALNVDENLVTTDMNAVDLNAVDLNATAAAPEAPAGWAYGTSSDELRGKTIYRASIDSANSADFDFPYAGGSTLTMTVRQHPAYGEDVIFAISKGQFVCGIDDCTGTINFGSGPESISLVEPEDHSSDTLFAANADYIIGKLKRSAKVIVELPFYQEGNRQFTFLTDGGLKWPPKGAQPKVAATEAENVVDE